MRLRKPANPPAAHASNSGKKCRTGRAFRPPEGAHRSVRDRDVGALFILRNGVAAGPLSGEVPAAARTGRGRDRVSGGQGRAGKHLRAAGPAALRLADLRVLRGLRVLAAHPGRVSRRPLFRPARDGNRRCAADGRRPFPHGGRVNVVCCARPARPRHGRIQAQCLDASRRVVCPERPAPRAGLFDLLCGHQHRRVSRAARCRHARR